MKINPAEILIKDYTYSLPTDKIAQFPLKERDNSKLLIYNNGSISQDIFKNISEVIPENSLLIFNKTKVINARLRFTSPADKDIEIFALEPCDEKELARALSKTGSSRWLCLVGNLKAWKEGKLSLHKNVKGMDCIFEAELISRQADAFEINFTWQPIELSFAEILEIFGIVPLPPYMKRDAVTDDNQTYQTVYAEAEGSVAAPTAGLHFTESVLNSLKRKNIISGFVTLHVGAGTFKPVKTENIAEHLMHSESFYIELELIENILANLDNNKIIAVGTTSMRTVESVYWFGLQLLQNRFTGGEVHISQWEPYENEPEDSTKALEAVIGYMKQNNLKFLYGKTNIIIVQGYDFKIFSGIITNFHQPSSTLLLLIAAFIGNDWKILYDYALKNDFRFLSYGDSSILLK